MDVEEAKHKELFSRRYAPGDEKGINSLYYKMTGRLRDSDKFAWQWLNGPDGPGSIWVIKESDSGETVGHHGLMAIQISYFGEPIVLGRTENCMMHPRYRGAGRYLPFEKKFLEEELEGRFHMLLTTWALGSHAKVRAALGYAPFSRWALYVKYLQPYGLVEHSRIFFKRRVKNRSLLEILMVAVRIAARGVTAWTSRMKTPSSSIELQTVSNTSEIEDAIEAFWERNKEWFGITIWRSARFLKWRIFDNPYFNNSFYMAYLNNRHVGYIVLRPEKKTGSNIRIMTILDIIAEKNDGSVLSDILAAALKKLNDEGVHVVRFRTFSAPNASIRYAIRDNKFIKMEMKGWKGPDGGARWMIKLLDEAVRDKKIIDPLNWYVTDLFDEGITHG